MFNVSFVNVVSFKHNMNKDTHQFNTIFSFQVTSLVLSEPVTQRLKKFVEAFSADIKIVRDSYNIW